MRLAGAPQLTLSLGAPEAPALLCALGLAFLHIALGSGLAGYALLLALAVPVGWAAAAAGPKGGYLAAAAALVALFDGAATVSLWSVAAELGVFAFVAPAAMYFGLSVRREDREIACMQTLVRQRIGRLRAEPGYWHEVASSRMGAHVTAVEAAFICESLEPKQTGVILDVGAGSGRLEFALREHATTVIATEVDADELSRMEDDPRVSPVAVGTLPSLPVRDRALDWVVAIEVPAVTEEAWFAAECARTLKADGGVLLMVYNRASYKGLVGRLLTGFRRARGVRWADLYYQHALWEHLRFWRAAGFEPARWLGLHWSPLPRGSNSPLVAAGSALERTLGLRRLTSVSPWVLLELRRTR